MMMMLAAAIPFLLLGGLALSAWYVSARLRTLFGMPAARRSTTAATALAVVALVVAVAVTAAPASTLAGGLYVLGGYTLTIYLYLLLTLLGLHAAQRFWTPAGTRRAGTVAVAIALVTTGLGGFRATSFSVRETDIPMPGLPHAVSVMHISDVHLGHHRGSRYLARVVEATNRRLPDLVFITGDLVDSNAALLSGVLDALADLAAPTYFVVGNHETYIDTQRALELIAGHNVRVLRNDVVTLRGLQLIGLDYMNADEQTFDMHPSSDTRTVKDVVAGLSLDASLPSILMQHSPAGAQYVEQAGVDLMVAGHTHAGQVFPGTLIAPLIFPFNRGLYRQGDLQIYVSQGVGTFLLPIRLGSSNEIDLLRLLPASE